MQSGEICSHTAKVFTGFFGLSSSSPSGFAKNLPLSLILRASVFYRQKLDSPKPFYFCPQLKYQGLLSCSFARQNRSEGNEEY
ncbi:hypothetical protein EZS27_022778 [termite gut metagenome]|uniref:Uncharacterized protein n=1 Tax=termite gut metagenome TaxID=433724 RepID=A0A5J4R6R8_9ZZZZ